MKILHTSDWHLGRTLYGRKRYEEFEAFLAWLSATIIQEKVEVLLIAGDVFDISVPTTRAQELYYRFLCRIAASSCRHIVVIAGNHDSASFLNAPRELLRALNVHVIGAATENYEEEVLVLTRQDGCAQLIVCAVPFLRDRDIRVVHRGEGVEDKEHNLIEGIRSHYAAVTALAEQKRQQQKSALPIVAMGHLFTTGGCTVDGDGVRQLYVGSLSHVSASIFPSNLDYVALGHLHVPQTVNGSTKILYSGSPLPMGFAEAKQEKSVCLIELTTAAAEVKGITVPVFQRLESIKGSWEEISVQINALSASQTPVWLEIVYEGKEVIADLRQRLEAACANTSLDILRIKNNRIIDRVLNQIRDDETLADLSVDEVFERCLFAHAVTNEQRQDMLRMYQETVASLYEENSPETVSADINNACSSAI